MSVDLNKLIGVKRFLVPVKAPNLSKAVFEQLKQRPFWKIETERTRSATFYVDWKKKWIQMSLTISGKKFTPKNIANKEKQYDENPIGCIDAIQKNFVDSVPIRVRYIIDEERIEGCTIKAVCKPLLYDKIVRGLDYEQVDLQDVKLSCEDFLDDIFIGGLRGKEILERKNALAWELLINDVNNHRITERIYKMLENATTCVLLMGWVGTELLPKFKELKDVGVTVKAVTHKPSELKAPVRREVQKGYRELIKLIGLNNVSVNPLLHGRTIIVDNKALVGSMDFNSHSLSGEHIEFAIYSEDVNIVRSLRGYFEKMFKPLKD